MLGDRLREERERLGLTQDAFSALAGGKRRTLIDWEKGVSSPTAVQLSALSKAGVDVLYVVTGNRAAQGVSEAVVAYAARTPAAEPAAPTRMDLARGTSLDPAWPMVLEYVVDALIDHGRQVPRGRKLRDLVDAVLVVLRLDEEGELDNEKLRRKIEAMV
ncbi:hypothetical protein CJ010_00710 [Azoarcus sp. DD4]|uniref:helix-turn-helix domain-containing protein n=1 Tax=Azoarcus sp. DD4 TaxID=2027405 RepID=UPI00112BE934|nr:helix-turn-helix transcriptional regulator [Azoarcus sp. DD4]QDF95174.1 hypothetical protein CJ010_00710 [Azoarcus sp. DD4]